MHRTPRLRTLAGLAAYLLLVLAVVGSLLTVLAGLFAAAAPDPYAPSGDPCCTPPETWGEVAWNLATVLGLAGVDGLLASAGIALLVWGESGRWPSVRRLVLIPACGLVLAVLLFAPALVPQLDDPRTPLP